MRRALDAAIKTALIICIDHIRIRAMKTLWKSLLSGLMATSMTVGCGTTDSQLASEEMADTEEASAGYNASLVTPIAEILPAGETFRWLEDSDIQAAAEQGEWKKPEFKDKFVEDMKLRRKWMVEDIGERSFWNQIEVEWSANGSDAEKARWIRNAQLRVLRQMTDFATRSLERKTSPKGRANYLRQDFSPSDINSRPYNTAPRHSFVVWNAGAARYDFVMSEATLKALNAITTTAAEREAKREQAQLEAQKAYEAKQKAEAEARKCNATRQGPSSCGMPGNIRAPLRVELNGAG